MQRKKFLALMLTAALAGQPLASVPVMAADAEAGDFSSEESNSEESAVQKNSLPVITEDLPTERIIYSLNEKSNPLKIGTENEENLRYLWLESEDNETFYEIKKADTEQDETADSAESENGEDKEIQKECGPEYTPPTDTPGNFYYKVRIWNQDETDESAYTESRTVCVQVLNEETAKEDSKEPDTEQSADTAGETSDTEEPTEADGEKTDTEKTAEADGEEPDTEESTEANGEESDTEESTEADGQNPDTEQVADTAEEASDTEESDTEPTEPASGADEETDAGNADMPDSSGTETSESTEGSEPTDDSEPAEDTEASENMEDLLPEEKQNHLPERKTDVPETETCETEGYWNVDLSEIFRDPDGDTLTYYEKGEREEAWTQIDGDSYLCHPENAEETYIFTAKDQEGYGEIYALTLKKKDETAAKQAKTTDADVFSDGEAKAASAKNVSFETAYKGTGAHLASMAETSAPVSGTLCGEWMVIGLVRSGQAVDASVYSRYKSNLVDTVKAKKGVLHAKKYTEYSRTILGLTAIGEDVTDVGGYNLLEPLADFDQTIWQGVNGTIWALLAFDSHDYEIPKTTEGKTQTTREKLIEDILSKEVSGGGWSMMGAADSDVTGMALQALAPYYNSNSSVKAAVDRAVAKLSTMQLSDGTFGTMGHSTSESCSQVVTGLAALGIDCNTDTRFIKNGHSLLQGLLSYYDGNGGFLHVAENGYDQMATEQAYYAMTAYSRMKNGETALYDMTDVAIKSDREKADEVTKLIDALPSQITMSNFQQVKTAYAAYNGLNSTQKSVITKARREKLLNAYKTAQEVEIQYVETLIGKIGKVTKASEEKITDAKLAYNSLSSEQKKKVSNYDVLVKAEKELEKLKKPTTTPTPVVKPSGKPGKPVNMVTPAPTATPAVEPLQPTPTVTPAQPAPTTKPGNTKPTVTPTTSTVKPTATPAAAQPSRTKSAGGSTKSVSAGSTKSSASSGTTGSKNGSSKTASAKKTSSEKSGSDKEAASATKAATTSTKASKKVISEMKSFFNTKGSNAYPEKIDDYTEKQIKALGKTWKNYEKLSEGEKKAVQENKVYESFQKLLSSLGKKYHFDQATGTNLDNNKEEALPWYVQMVVNPKIADDNESETIRKVLGEKSEVLSLNEIHFVDTLTGDSWEPKDVLKVQLPMADLGDYESCMIVHITDEGKVEFLKGKISGSYISFDAAEFSAYGIAGFMGDSDEILSGQQKGSPVWPWIAAGGAACVLVILMGGIRIAGSRKKKGKKK